MSAATLVTDALSVAALLQPPQVFTHKRRGPEHSSSERRGLNITQFIFNERRGSGTYCAERRSVNIATNFLIRTQRRAFHHSNFERRGAAAENKFLNSTTTQYFNMQLNST